MDLPTFDGNATTTSDDIISFYSASVMNRVPGILAHTEILGCNVVDSSATSIGMLATSATATGAGVGSVIGIAAVDSIKHAVKSGKKARGAGKDDGYKFGDFTRGSVRNAGKAIKAGAERRRGDSSRYVPGDLTVGASAAVGDYVGENKSRLGAAGAGGAGAMVGMAVLAGPLAPVGLVAGSILGAKAGSAVLGSDKSAESSKTFGKETQATQAASHPSATPSASWSKWTAYTDPSSGRIYYSDGSRTTWEKPSELSGGGGVAPAAHITAPDNDAQRNQAAAQAQNQRNLDSNEDFDLLGMNGSTTAPATRQQNVQQSTRSESQRQHLSQGISQHVASAHPVVHSLPSGANHASAHHGHTGDYQRQSYGRYSSAHSQPQQQQQQQQQGNSHHEGYRFGDISRGIVAKGKKKRGDEKSGYKFGDFTRGLLG